MSYLLPAVLSTNLEKTQKRFDILHNLVEWVHVDIMDGQFVNNTTLNPFAYSKINTKIKMEAHLMVQDPQTTVTECIENNFQRIIFHIEPVVDAGPLIQQIKKNKKEAGIALNPDTSIERILPYLAELDMVLLMSVYPGFSGQSFIPETITKIRELTKIIKDNNYKTEINVDGGIRIGNAYSIIEAGATWIVANSAIFDNDHLSPVDAITEFNQILK